MTALSRSRPVERWLPFVLLGLSVLGGWAIGAPYVPRRALAWSLLPTALLVLVRTVAEPRPIRPGSRHAGVLAIVLGVLTLALVVLNPMGAIYTFSGYLDSERWLRGRPRLAALLTTGALSALGQVGGWPGLRGNPVFFLVLLIVNVGIATGMRRLERQREREVAERERVAEELADAHRRNLELADELLDRARTQAVTDERERLSREIHDTVAQGLVGVIMQLEAIDETDEATRRRVERADATARDCLAEARRAVRALASPRLDEADLTTALARLALGWEETNGVPVDLDLVERADTGHDGVLLRVAQESLSNVARHARASGVRLGLEVFPDSSRLTIADDGCGFDPSTTRCGHGVDGMRARLAGVGGRLRLDAAPGSGCTITAEVPR